VHSNGCSANVRAVTPPLAPDPEPVPLPELLADAASWIGRPATEVSGGAKAERVLALDALIDRLRLEQVRTLGAFDADGTWASDGARTAASWLGARAAMSRGRAGHLVARGRELRSASAVKAAWEAGRIGEEVAFALLRARRVHERLFDEQVGDLLGWLDGLRVDHALTAIRHWTHLAANTAEAERAEGADGSGDPDDAEPVDPAAENRAGLHQSFQGRWNLEGDFDAITGAEIDERIKAWIDRQFQQGTYRADDALTYAQRVAAAIAALTERGAIEGQTRHQGPRPSVSLHLDLRTMAGEPCDDVADAMTRRSNLVDGAPISRATAERLLCNARLTALAERLGPLGQVEVAGITELQRDATAHQRKALVVRDGGCAFPGCEAPADWCDAHHLLPWDDGGATTLDNLVLLCKHHHHLVHEGGWTLWRAIDGRLYLTDPSGHPVAVTPHGRAIDLDDPPPAPPSPPPRRPGELRFLTPRERAARVAERERRRQEADRRAAEAAADAEPLPTRGRAVFGPHAHPHPHPAHGHPPRHGPPAA